MEKFSKNEEGEAAFWIGGMIVMALIFLIGEIRLQVMSENTSPWGLGMMQFFCIILAGILWKTWQIKPTKDEVLNGFISILAVLVLTYLPAFMLALGSENEVGLSLKRGMQFAFSIGGGVTGILGFILVFHFIPHCIRLKWKWRRILV